MTGTLLAESLINGLITGAIYALVGAGVALIYGTMRVLNFAHGEMMMLGAYFAWMGVAVAGLPVLLAFALALIGVMIVAAVIQRAVVAPVLAREDWSFRVIAATIGLSVALQSAAQLIWGEKFNALPYFLDGVVQIGPMRLPWQRAAIPIVAFVALGLSALLLYRSRFGQMIRATAQDAEAAQAVGIPAGLVHTAVFALSAGLAAIAAIMLAPIMSVNPWMGLPYILKAFAVVILGGLGNFGGAIAAGLLLGLVESFGVMVTSSEWRDVISYGLLIAIIWVRPYGLFGGREAA
ncbi:branched-chain amino acid ABC transporter permease [Paracoccus sp. S-4012]|uniref:branched-chain amino acid ABC transporter permease n=1 Tax=Paracoccus sp. S-4012 TaxID=2665648 RepID=UPI0012B0B4B4|nr:branched-chain amino acid ABC transporter permease [Paracoccus sp. S-4012]MRX49185.1 branched-chain amino acid ABC transporter permease [Paracoccus sp. S-4012]